MLSGGRGEGAGGGKVGANAEADKLMAIFSLSFFLIFSVIYQSWQRG